VVRGVAGLLASLSLLGAGWWLLAPPRLGGSTSFVSVDGTSMLPGLHRSDLVVIRARPQYAVGDVVAYRSRLFGRVVLHRIVAIHRGRYVFKGDSNEFTDPDQPTRHDLIGTEVVHVPRAGQLVAAAHTPAIAALFAVALVFAAGLGGPRDDTATGFDARRG
jgi:signal peptidase I